MAEGGDVSDDRLKELGYSARERPLDPSRRHVFHERLYALVYVRLYPRDEKRDEGD